MQITRFTDLGLRVLMYLCIGERSEPVTITEIATRFDVSRHHLVKVVHRLGQLKWIVTTRGKGGGLALARPPADYRLGDIVRALEDGGALIDCSAPPCALRRDCNVKSALDGALAAFYAKLNESILSDVVRRQTAASIVELHRLGGHG